MRKLGIALSALLLMCLASSVASATTITIFQAEYQIDGGTPVAVSFPVSGLGSFSVGLGPSAPGPHYVAAFIDPEIDEAINTFFNEIGARAGSPAAGQTWEIDEPGYVFGDIYTNFLAGTLDNTDNVLPGSPDDVSMALGWNFTLTGTEVASISFTLSNVSPAGGFYLIQSDPDSQSSVYFSSQLNIRNTGPNVIPEPSTIVLLLSGLGLAIAARFRKSA